MSLHDYSDADLADEMERRKRAVLTAEFNRRSLIIDHVVENLGVFNSLLLLMGRRTIERYSLNPTDIVEFHVREDEEFSNRYHEKP